MRGGASTKGGDYTTDNTVHTINSIKPEAPIICTMYFPASDYTV